MSASETTRDCLIVVPCFNEARRLDPDAFARFAADQSDCGFIFVDDGSSDDTLGVLEQLQRHHPTQFDVIRLPKRRGKAEAVRTGVRKALAMAPRAIGYWDADLSTPLSAIPAFVACLEQRADVQIVLGSRVKLIGRTIERHVWRHYLGRVFATATSLILRLPIYDTQCGAKLFRVTEETERLFDAPFETGWVFDVELLARFIGRRRARAEPVHGALYELPLHEWRHASGSKIGVGAFVAAPCDLIRVARLLRAQARRD